MGPWRPLLGPVGTALNGALRLPPGGLLKAPQERQAPWRLPPVHTLSHCPGLLTQCPLLVLASCGRLLDRSCKVKEGRAGSGPLLREGEPECCRAGEDVMCPRVSEPDAPAGPLCGFTTGEAAQDGPGTGPLPLTPNLPAAFPQACPEKPRPLGVSSAFLLSAGEGGPPLLPSLQWPQDPVQTPQRGMLVFVHPHGPQVAGPPLPRSFPHGAFTTCPSVRLSQPCVWLHSVVSSCCGLSPTSLPHLALHTPCRL